MVTDPSSKPLIHELMAQPRSGDDIERHSFEIIEELVPARHRQKESWPVLRRLIHASGDAGLAEVLKVTQGAIKSGVEALKRGAPLVVDATMIRAGLSLSRLQRACSTYTKSDVHCHITDADVAEEARRTGLPRSLFSLRKAKDHTNGGVVAFGNSPVALLELNRLIVEENVKPALVIGFPVGFVNVKEAKKELADLDVPSLILTGNRGGSPLAVAAIHALCGLVDSEVRFSSDFDAVILLGHGSRVPRADDSMVHVARQLRERMTDIRIETCSMSRLPPHFPETLDKVVIDGAQNVLVVPYFLHTGVHIQLDIPEMMQECAQRYPKLRLVYGAHLGYDDSLVSLVEQRVASANAAPDVRELALPPRSAFPVPPGQKEFVPMAPEIASRWREKFGLDHDHGDHHH